MRKVKAKALVLLSGGLDSRLAAELLRQQGIQVKALHFVFPFGSGCCKSECSFKFTQLKGIPLQIIDCSSGKNFREYLKIVKKPKHGHGSAMNPCIDCRIFMLRKAAEIMKAEKADFVATGEVLNERPMSQRAGAMKLIEKESRLQGKLLRPLSAKLLPETEAEMVGLVNRSKLLAINGRSRKQQIELAKKFKISYPAPAGGCLLCEKEFAKKLADLFKHKKKIFPEDIELLKIGRHFRFGNAKIIVGRNEKENKMLSALKGKKDLMFEVVGIPSPITLLSCDGNEEAIKKAAQLTAYYSDAKNKQLKQVEVKFGKEKLNKSLFVRIPEEKEVDELRVQK
jgi:tRNA U34 2-thiouridine synthase MnmA/TrmU